jgi:hypothetical protein
MWRLDEQKRRERAQWRRRWRTLPHPSQRAINHALTKGRAVADQDLAPLATEAAAQRLGWISTPGVEGRPPPRLIALGYAAMAVIWLAGADETSEHILGVLWLTLAAGSLGAWVGNRAAGAVRRV